MATKSLKRQLQQACERFDALRDEIYAAASMTCDHDWEQVNPRIFDGQRCLRCGTWK